MATFKLVVRRILEHRARRLTVLTITLVIALGGVGLAADKYFGLRREAAELRSDLAIAMEEASQLNDLKLEHAQIQEALEQHQSRAVDDQNIDIVRDEIVMLILDSKCKFRRVEINDSQSRGFSADDNPLEEKREDNEDDLFARGSGYDLRYQEAAVEVSGKLENIKALLAQMHTMKRLVHVSGMQITQEATTREIQLRANLVFFGLQKSKQTEGEGLLPPGVEPPEPPPPGA